MNSKQIFSGLAVLALAVVVVMTSQVKAPTPGPNPTPEPVNPASAVAQAAANDIATFGNGLADVCERGAAKIKAGEFKTTKAAAEWQRAQNETVRFDAFTPWHTAIDEAKKVSETEDSLDKLAEAWEQSAIGFRAGVVKGK